MFAGWEKREGGRKRKAYMRRAWNREKQGGEEQTVREPGSPGSRAKSYAKEASGLILIF